MLLLCREMEMAYRQPPSYIILIPFTLAMSASTPANCLVSQMLLSRCTPPIPAEAIGCCSRNVIKHKLLYYIGYVHIFRELKMALYFSVPSNVTSILPRELKYGIMRTQHESHLLLCRLVSLSDGYFGKSK